MGQCRPYGVETSKSKNKQLIEMLTGCLPLQLITRIRIIHTTDQEQWRTLLHRRLQTLRVYSPGGSTFMREMMTSWPPS